MPEERTKITQHPEFYGLTLRDIGSPKSYEFFMSDEDLTILRDQINDILGWREPS